MLSDVLRPPLDRSPLSRNTILFVASKHLAYMMFWDRSVLPPKQACDFTWKRARCRSSLITLDSPNFRQQTLHIFRPYIKPMKRVYTT